MAHQAVTYKEYIYYCVELCVSKYNFLNCKLSVHLFLGLCQLRF